MKNRPEAIQGGTPPTQPLSVQHVIEVAVDGLDGRTMFAVIDGAIEGAPVGTLVRVKVGSSRPPTWLTWIEHPVNWQFVTNNWAVQAEWLRAIGEAV